MTPVQREARTFLSQFHRRPFTVSDLEKALQEQGFSLVEYSRISNGKEVTTLLTSLRLLTMPPGNPPSPIRIPTCGSFLCRKTYLSRSK